MTINIGDQAAPGFDDPLGLMRDCHRRIEKFLGVLLRVVADTGGSLLDDEHRAALEAALRYFKDAAPRHTRDEEDSLFPRLRALSGPSVRGVMARIDTLEQDHVDADTVHGEVDRLGASWIDQGTLPAADIQKLRRLLEQLRLIYSRHIAEEDAVVFPLAQAILLKASLIAIGGEMAERRGLALGEPSKRCRHPHDRLPSSTHGGKP